MIESHNLIVNNSENFFNGLTTKSFFDNEKLIIVTRTTDKIHSIIEEIIEKNEQSHWNWTKKEENGKHCIAKITADNWDTHILVKKISQQLGIGQRAVGFAGTKDKRAVTTQLLSFPVDEEKVSNLEIKDVSIDILGKSNRKIKLGELIGNDFTIKITNTKNRQNKKEKSQLLLLQQDLQALQQLKQ